MDRILLVHQSRVIRATLTSHLKDLFEVVEALDGEVAWQSLVLDHHIVAVISGPDLPNLGAMDLLERLRRNRLQRLKRMPFFFVGSETKIAEIEVEARSLGVSDFLRNGMAKWDMLPLLRKHLGSEEAAPHTNTVKLYFRDAGLLTPAQLEEGVRQMFTSPKDKGSLLVFGIDHFDELAVRLGLSTAERITDKFARLVLSKIGNSDFMGHHSTGRFVIASRTCHLEQCEAFARRVARSLAAAQIVVRGQPVKVTLSAGAAGRPEDGAQSGERLLTKALVRLEHAHQGGGNRVLVRDEHKSRSLSHPEPHGLRHTLSVG